MFPGQERLLAISPHLDDAVLSYGAGLAGARQNGATVTVYTVFAGPAAPPYSEMAERLHASWGLAPDQNAPLYRRGEDAAALDHLGVGHRHGRFLDAMYRKAPDGRWLIGGGRRAAIRQRLPEDNGDLVAAVTRDIVSLIEECAATSLLTCVAVGEHVDHRIARDATLLAAAAKNLPVRLWQDLPYAADVPTLPELPAGTRLGPADHAVAGPRARDHKFRAVRHYKSQLSMLDGSEKDLFTKLDDHARAIAPSGGYAETTWPVIRRPPTPDP